MRRARSADFLSQRPSMTRLFGGFPAVVAGVLASYLPPKKLCDAKVEEISQTRHRVAHFR